MTEKNNIFEIIKNKKPNFKKINFSCDEMINPKLENQGELIKDFLNKSFSLLIVGSAGSGKTSLTINFLLTFKKCYNRVVVFMPKSSRMSLKNNIFDKYLPEEQVYDELNEETITDFYEKVKTWKEEDDYKTIVVFDDVQKSMKNQNVVKIMKNLFANRRHLGLSIIVLLQNFFALDRSIRELAGNVIAFKVGKVQTMKLFDEVIETDKDQLENIRDIVYDEPHSWFFINIETQRMFRQFDELVKKD